MDKWLQKITDWFYDLIKSVFDAITGFFHDVFMWAVNAVFDGIGFLLSSIPTPDFLLNNNIGSLINQLPSFALYCVSHAHIPEAMLILLSGILFRLARKFFTLGQW